MEQILQFILSSRLSSSKTANSTLGEIAIYNISRFRMRKLSISCASFANLADRESKASWLRNERGNEEERRNWCRYRLIFIILGSGTSSAADIIRVRPRRFIYPSNVRFLPGFARHSAIIRQKDLGLSLSLVSPSRAWHARSPPAI